jgi:hypothetical protein
VKLQALSLSDFKRLTDISALAKLQNLLELELSCGIWNKLPLESIEPIGHLKALECLALAPQMKDPSLEPLARLTQLRELSLNNRFPMEDFAKLAGKLPHVKCPNFDELFDPFPHKMCRKCGEPRLVIPIGKGARMMCQDCDDQKIADYAQNFETIKKESASRNTW